MATFIQKASGTGSNASSASCSLTGVGAGNTIILAVAWDNSGRSFTNVTSSPTQTWVLAGAQATSGDGKLVSRVEYVLSATGGNYTFTVNIGGGANVTITAYEYSGITAFDIANQTTGTTANPASPSVTTTADGDLIFGWGVVESTTAPTAGSGFTSRATILFTTSQAMGEDETQTTAGSVNATFTHASGTWTAHVAAFKSGAGGGGGGSTVASYMMMGIG